MGAVFFSGHYDLDYGHTWEELPDSIRYASPVLTEAAELGEGAVSQITFDDPDGDLVDVIVGLRDFRMDEDEAPVGNQNVYRGAIGDRTYGRGDGEHSSLIFDSQHQIACDLVDTNWFLDSRIFHGSDGDRPSETAGDRLRWLLTRQEFIGYDFGNVEYDDVNTLDANDYDGLSLKNVLADCILPGGYNYWVRWNETEDKSELFVIHPDSAGYATTARLTNVLADADGGTTFLVNDDWTLKRSPSRVTGGCRVEFGDGQAVYDMDVTTIDAFAWVDRVAPLANVKTEAAATQLVAKFLEDNSEEADRLSGSVFVLAAHVNDILPGHRVQGQFLHLPGYGDAFHWFRVLRRTVRQEPRPAEPGYTLFLDLVPCADPPTYDAVSATYLGLHDHVGSDGLCYWDHWGDPAAAAGSFSAIDASGDSGHSPCWAGITIDRDGILTVAVFTSFSTVVTRTTTATFTLAVGGHVTSEQVVSGYHFGPAGWGAGATTTLSNIAVSAGDTIVSTIEMTDVDGNHPYPNMPGGGGVLIRGALSGLLEAP